MILFRFQEENPDYLTPSLLFCYLDLICFNSKKSSGLFFPIGEGWKVGVRQMTPNFRESCLTVKDPPPQVSSESRGPVLQTSKQGTPSCPTCPVCPTGGKIPCFLQDKEANSQTDKSNSKKNLTSKWNQAAARPAFCPHCLLRVGLALAFPGP